MVLLQPVTFAESDDIFIHKSLRAVDNNILLSHLKPWQCAGEDELFRSAADNCKRFSKITSGLVNNTQKLLDDCSLEFDREGLKEQKDLFCQQV